MNYSCNQEIAQDLLLNWNYDKDELARELGIRVFQLNYFLNGAQIKKQKASLSSKLAKISNRYKQQNSEYRIHTIHARTSILKKSVKQKREENE